MTGYLVMILSPILIFFFKFTVSYEIRYNSFKGKHFIDKHFKKNKTNLISRFFYWDLRHKIKKHIFILNFILGILLFFSLALSSLYLFFWICNYQLKMPIIPYVVAKFEFLMSIIYLIIMTPLQFKEKYFKE